MLSRTVWEKIRVNVIFISKTLERYNILSLLEMTYLNDKKKE